jgi:hypothetical protein
MQAITRPAETAAVADAINTNRSTRAHSQLELLELASDCKTVVIKSKCGDKSQAARPLSADISTSKLQDSKPKVRPASVGSEVRLSTPENITKPIAGILKTSATKSIKASGSATSETSFVDSHKTAVEQKPPTGSSSEETSTKKLTFSETIDVAADTAEAGKPEVAPKIVAKTSDDESESSTEHWSEPTASGSASHSLPLDSKADEYVFELPKPPSPPTLPIWLKAGPAPTPEADHKRLAKAAKDAKKVKEILEMVRAKAIADAKAEAYRQILAAKLKSEAGSTKPETVPPTTDLKPSTSIETAATDVKTTLPSLPSKSVSYSHSKMADKPCGTHYEPKPFSASDKDSKAREWLDFFERYVAFKEMSHERRIAYFGLLMRGPAEVWWNSLIDSIKHNYGELRKSFLASFANEDFHKLRAATEMHTRKQGPTETVTDYYTAMVNLTKDLPAITEEILYYLILNGLKSHIKVRVLEADVKTLEQLLTVAKKAELAYNVIKTDDPILAAVLDELKLSRQATEENKAQVKALGGQVSNLAAMQAITRPAETAAAAVTHDSQTSDQNRQRPYSAPNRPQNNTQNRTQNFNQNENYRTNNGRASRPQNWPQRSPGQTQQRGRQIDCRNCGRTHEVNNCGVRGLNCFNCGRQNHIARMCRSAPQNPTPRTYQNQYQQFPMHQGYQQAPQQ